MRNKTTLKDIAEKLNVSVGTVHRAIHNKTGVGEKLRMAILKEAKQSNFIIDEAASVLRRNEINIAVMLPLARGEDRYFFASMWEGAKEMVPELKKLKVKLQFLGIENDTAKQNEILAQVYDDQIENINGLLTIACDEEGATEWINRYSNRGVPVALVNTDAKASKRISFVAVSYIKAGQLAGEAMCRFLGGKKEKVLVLAGEENIYSHREYVNSFERYITEFNPAYEIIKIYGFRTPNLDEKLRKTLQENPDITGIFSSNARNTYIMCKVIQSLNLSGKVTAIGADVFNEITPFFEDGTLTASIYQSPKLQIKKAIQMLYEHIAHHYDSDTREKKIEYVPVCLVMQTNYTYYL